MVPAYSTCEDFIMRRLLAPAVLAATLPGMVAAQDRPSLLDYFSIDTIVQRFVQSGIMALRTQLDLKYSDISVDIRTGGITMTDLKAWPLPDWDEDGTCEISIDRINIRSGALDQPERIRLKAQLTGTAFPTSCLPEEPREVMAMAGVTKVNMPRMTIDIDYGIPGSDAVMRMYADVDGVAAVDVTADFAYIWVDGRDDIEEPLPVIFLKNAALTLENNGIWESLKGQLPPPFLGDGSGVFLEGMLGQEFINENDGETLTESQTAFLKSLATSWPAFQNAPERIVLETNLTGDVFVDVEQMDGDLEYVFETLQPIVSLAPSSVNAMLPLDLLQKALASNKEAMSDDDLRRAGIALITGVGAPRNLEAGYNLLEPLIEKGDGPAATAIAKMLETRDPEESYRLSLLAGKAGETGATARLDRLERVISFERVLELQDDVTSREEASPDILASVATVRAAAAQYLSGRGAPRSYEAAALLAMIASAAGDPEAGDILGIIDERVRLAGPAAQEPWSRTEAKASGEATDVWIKLDLPARFGN